MSLLSEPVVHKQVINEWDVENKYKPYFTSGNKIYKVTVLPNKNSLARVPVKTIIQIPVFGRTGNLLVQNLGRDPVNPPMSNEDDLRPISFYISGRGRCEVKVSSKHDPQDCIVKILEFN